jgi:hypothetical protein
MSKKKNPKYYLVLSKSRNYTYGAFPYTKEGKRNAEAFIRKSKKEGEELYLAER